MNQREPPAGTEPSQGSEDPREERLQALYSAAYLALDPSDALEQRVAQITARPSTEPARSRWWQRAPGLAFEHPAPRATVLLGAAGAGSFAVTLLAAALLSFSPARETRSAGRAVARQWSLEAPSRRAVWLGNPEPSVLPFPMTQPEEEATPPREPRPLPVRRSQRRGSTSAA